MANTDVNIGRPPRRLRKLAIVAVGSIIVLLAGATVANRLTSTTGDFTQIEPGLYVGGRATVPPPDTAAVLNLCQAPDLYHVQVADWQPIADRAPAPSLEWLAARVEFVRQQRAAGRTVFVHCYKGASRSPMVVAAYLMQRDHLTRDQALTHLRAQRPAVRPNAAFMALLTAWERQHAEK